MQKSQKIWLWLSSAMFLVPEVFFSFILSFFALFMGVENFPFLAQSFFGSQFFMDNSEYLFTALGIECLGMLGLLIWNIKFNHNRYKVITTTITALVLALLLFIFYIGYAVSNISF